MRELSVSQWIRQALRAPLERERAVARKLEAVRRAAKCSCPSGDIEQMLAEIEKGYL
jgi:Arc/MetJ-type ribon-helix-helix transcriptional regulator